MSDISLNSKRRKYNKNINFLKSILNDYYNNKGYSVIEYPNNIATTVYHFLNDIYNFYDADFKENPQKYDNDINIKQSKCTVHILHVLESILIKYKSRIKEIDKELY